MKRVAFLLLFALSLTLGGAAAFAGDDGGTSMSGMGSTPSSGQAAPASGQSSNNTVIIQNFAFTPANITVPRGTMVMWFNRDTTTHTVTGENSGGPSSGPLKPGENYGFTFAQSGVFPYHCSIHPSMRGTVTVTASSSSSAPATTAPTPPATTQTPSVSATANSSSTSNTFNTFNNNAGTTAAANPATNSVPAAANTPSVLPNTGALGAVAAFASAAVVGTGLYRLYMRFKTGI